MASAISFVPSRKGPSGLSVNGEEKQRYDRMFMSLLPPGSHPNQLVGGDKMKEVFLKSGLQPKVLGVIWEKSDLTKDGSLDNREFAIAMCLIEHVLGGNTIPPVVPQQVINMNIPPPTVSAPVAGPTPAPGGPPPGQMQNSQSAFGFGNAFIPGAPTGPQSATTLPRPMGPVPQVPQHKPVPDPRFSATMPLTTNSVIDSAFGQPAFGAPPVIPARNDAPGQQANAWAFGTPPPTQVAPQRKDSLPIGNAFGAAPPVTDWLVPVASRAKYRQQFTLSDVGKTGAIGANVARNLLLQTKVDTNILARIWNLSSLRGQASLNSEEFVLAMHLCDMVKGGEQLPATLPPLLVPPSFRDPRAVIGQAPMDVTNTTGVSSAENTADQQAQKQPMPVSFEDKRRQNFDLGEQALERKRQALLEQQRREKEERMEKERQEEERRARERAEQERKRAEQIAEQQRRLDEARKEAEAKAQAEHDRRIALSLESRIASARNQMTHLRSQNSQMDSDIQVLASKKRSLDQQMEETRNSENMVRNSLNEKNQKYAERRKDLEKLQLQLQEFQRNLKTYSDKKMSIADQLKQQALRNPIAERHSQAMASLEAEKRKVSNLKQQITTAEKETAAKFHKIDLLNSQINECKALLAKGATQNNINSIVANQTTKPSTPAKVAASTTDKYNVFADAFKEDPFSTTSPFNSNSNSSDPFKPSSEDPFGGATTGTNGVPDDPFGAGANDPFKSSTTDPFASKAFSNQSDTTSPFIQQSTTKPQTAAPSEVLFEALYDFTTTDEGDLPFKVGDIIKASAEQNLDEPWLAGFLNGVGGWFPQNYTKRIEDPSSTSANLSAAPSHKTSVVSNSPADLFVNSANTAPSDNTDADNSTVCRVRAIYPFEATAEGDLGFTAGEEISVTSTEGDWWTGFLSRDPSCTKGIFPSNFVEEIPNPFPTSANPMASGGLTQQQPIASTPQTLSLPGTGDAGTEGKGGGQEMASVIANFQGDSPEQLTLNEGQVVIVKKKLPSGWWEGQIQGEKRKGWFPGDYVRVISSGLTPMPSANSSPERKADDDRVRAVYAFSAEREDELSFNVGDVISIISRDDPDWWRGELSGRMGLFPANFVSPLGS
ncbi:intersectin-1-like isoform X3 [Symsagittifera roscoffensis]|uniref:intersectin-1-like isoform X3 n=1 Tax=Symsagittifera roscoffensis TaxID=84072 RepID=UPI00307B10F8